MNAVDAVDALADALCTDHQQVVALLEPVLPPDVARELAIAWELCPVHFVDVRICEDDATEACAAARAVDE